MKKTDRYTLRTLFKAIPQSVIDQVFTINPSDITVSLPEPRKRPSPRHKELTKRKKRA